MAVSVDGILNQFSPTVYGLMTVINIGENPAREKSPWDLGGISTAPKRLTLLYKPYFRQSTSMRRLLGGYRPALIPNWNSDQNLGATTGLRLDSELAMQQIDPLGHVPYPHALFGAGTHRCVFVLDTDAIVFDPQREVFVGGDNGKLHMGGLGMFTDIVEPFLDQPIDIYLQQGGPF